MVGIEWNWILKACTGYLISQGKSGQVLILQVDSVVIRSAKPYLATPGATVHGHYGEILYEGDTLVTFIYEKSRSGDINKKNFGFDMGRFEIKNFSFIPIQSKDIPIQSKKTFL